MNPIMQNLVSPMTVPEGSYKAVVVNGRFGLDQRERGRRGVILTMRVEGPQGPAELEHFAGLDDSIALEALAVTFARGHDFLTTTDPSDTVGVAVWAVVRRRPWQSGRDWIEVASVQPRCS